MDIKSIFETYAGILIVIFIIKFFYNIILIIKICDTANQTYISTKKQEEIIELLNEQNSKLERIAKTLEETDTEPYYINTKMDIKNPN